jgi:hypothetical protein
LSLFGLFSNAATMPVAAAALRPMPSFSEPRPSGPSTRAAGVPDGASGAVAPTAGANAAVDGEGAAVGGAEKPVNGAAEVAVEPAELAVEPEEFAVALVVPCWQAVSAPARPTTRTKVWTLRTHGMRMTSRWETTSGTLLTAKCRLI